MKNFTPNYQLAFVLLVCQLGSAGRAQTMAFAKSKVMPQTDLSVNAAAPKRLKDILNELSRQHKVSILFEESVVQGITVAYETAQASSRKLEKQLESLLKPYGLNYKKIGQSQYVVFSTKSERLPSGGRPWATICQTGGLG